MGRKNVILKTENSFLDHFLGPLRRSGFWAELAAQGLGRKNVILKNENMLLDHFLGPSPPIKNTWILTIKNPTSLKCQIVHVKTCGFLWKSSDLPHKIGLFGLFIVLRRYEKGAWSIISINDRWQLYGNIGRRTYESIGRRAYGNLGRRTYGNIGCRTYGNIGCSTYGT